MQGEKMEKLKQLLEKNQSKVFPSATFSIVTPGNIQLDYVGDADIDKLYDLASLTKVIVTNTLIGFAVEENRLSLNDKLSDYIPEYKYLDIINGIYSPLTIEELLIHQSALKVDNIKEELKKMYKQDPESANRRCKQNLKNIKIDMDLVNIIDGKITKKVSYANINYILLKELLENIYNTSFDILARQKIFKSLNMNNSHFNKINDNIDPSKYAETDPTDYRGLIKGCVHDENAFFLGGVSGNAGLFSDIKDVSTFVQMILNDGKYKGKKYISKEIIDTWFKPYNSKRTLGWELYDNNIIKHTGFTGTCIFINRNKNIAIVILTNRINYGRENRKIYDLFDEIYKLYS